MTAAAADLAVHRAVRRVAARARGPVRLSARAAVGTRWPLAVAFALPLAIFWLEGRIGYGKADEGFLWYGAQRVLAGEVPLRDFQSYDIGRYYWLAAWMTAVGDDGLVAMRLGNAMLAAFTVALATGLVRTVDRTRPALVLLAACTFVVWMVPEYKAADSFAAVVLIAGLAFWFRDARARGAFAFGLCLGVAATIGINHALYGTIGGALGLLVLHRRGRAPFAAARLGALAAGTVLGYLPVLVAGLLVPGFAVAFIDGIRLLVEAGTTNVPVPFPQLDAAFGAAFGATSDATAPASGLRESVLAALFLGTPVAIVAALLRARREPAFVGDPRRATFTAATLLAIPYAHYAWSCPELMHAAVSGLPLVLVAWTWPCVPTPRRVVVLLAITGGSLFLFVNARDGYPALRGRPLETVTIAGDRLRVAAETAREVRLVQRVAARFPGRAFYAGHDWPGAYAAQHRRAPTWTIYALFPTRSERQAREIARLDAVDPAFAIVTLDRPGVHPDGLERTDPLLLAYLERCMQRSPGDEDPMLPVRVYLADADRCTPPEASP